MNRQNRSNDQQDDHDARDTSSPFGESLVSRVACRNFTFAPDYHDAVGTTNSVQEKKRRKNAEAEEDDLRLFELLFF